VDGLLRIHWPTLAGLRSSTPLYGEIVYCGIGVKMKNKGSFFYKNRHFLKTTCWNTSRILSNKIAEANPPGCRIDQSFLVNFTLPMAERRQGVVYNCDESDEKSLRAMII
jgi:hypothetical protein